MKYVIMHTLIRGVTGRKVFLLCLWLWGVFVL